MPSCLLSPSLLAQALLGAGALASIAFAPPAQGRMTIVSLRGQTGDQIARWTLDGNIRLVAAGAHSITVEGDRASLMLQALRQGALVVAAQPGPCGEERPA